ncbi:MAG: class I SAM-dependent methyltransferase [Candidatus Omnitrophota bacterium]|nr:class I SAM-dependent methyltransferase [Candidatus Omnitrophota bacterium]
MEQKPLVIKLLYLARNLRSKALFKALKCYCRGEVLDIGGWDFYLIARRKNLNFNSWTSLECSSEKALEIDDKRYRFCVGDGCNLEYEDNSFDTILNVHVLEHVFEPIKMVKEISRVLKINGYAIFLIPQTSTMHMAPHHYYNFTRFWIKEVMERVGLDIVQIKPLGGLWSSMASHLVFFFLQSFRLRGMSIKENKRNLLFYFLYPFMVLYAIISIPVCLILSLGDLTEEPNNYLVIVKNGKQSISAKYYPDNLNHSID